MALINSRILQVARNEVLHEMNKRISMFKLMHPHSQLIYLDGSDAALPLAASVLAEMRHGISEMTRSPLQPTPLQGYPFLLNAIAKHDFRAHGLKISADEIFVNAGAKQDISGISDILCKDNRLALMDPVSQIYVKSNAIGYRAGVLEGSQWSNVVYLPANKDTDYLPAIPEERFDVVFLSSPCNPTGMAFTRAALAQWVNYAIANDIIILFDATYEAFVGDADLVRSIYEIKGAAKVAIEFHSFAKHGGFTGMHCGYTVIPREVTAYSLSYEKRISLHDLWQQRLIVKPCAPSYLTQRAAAAIYTAEGKAQTAAAVQYYMLNAAMLRQALSETHLRFCGGENAPYIWLQSPSGDAWALFDMLLSKCSIVSSVGDMYGGNPDGCVRISAMADRKYAAKACEALASMAHQL